MNTFNEISEISYDECADLRRMLKAEIERNKQVKQQLQDLLQETNLLASKLKPIKVETCWPIDRGCDE